MAPATHRIQRLVLAAHATEREQAQSFSQALRELLEPRLLPVIEAACDALAGPNELLRIDRIEIDLGRLPGGLGWPGANPSDDFANLASQRLAELLPAVLAQAASAQPAHDNAAELLLHFAGTGTLPWWADATAPALLNDSMAKLLASATGARALLRSLAGRADAWRRLLLGLQQGQRRSTQTLDPGAAFDRLLLVLHPSWLALSGERLQTLADTLVPPLSAAELAQHWWPPLLASAGRGVEPLRLVSQALHELARQGDAPASALWLAWGRSAAWQAPVAKPMAERLTARFAEHWATPQADEPSPALSGHDDDASLAALLRSWAGAGSAAANALWGRLAGALHRLPPDLRRSASALVGRDQSGAYANTSPDLQVSPDPLALADPQALALTQALAALVDAARTQGLLSAHTLDEALANLPSPCPDALAALAQQLRARPNADNPLPTLADTLHLDNAGIVLLWPFLATFFERLGLVSARAFVDEPAAQRAVRLLHCLASGDPDPAEHQLPLCKLLCGLDLLAPIDEAAPLTEDELAQSQDLLHAVIAQASVLAGLSVDGLRGSFLLRAGQLSAQDDHHLLRVERQSWDIVLARLPWSSGVVKLPWMPAVLQVQW